MYCEQCGQELDDDARFCTSCGASIGVSEDAAAGGAIGEASGGAHTEPGEVHAVAGGAHTESAGVAAMHAEQVQADSASAQAEPENKPVSFSTVMNETKARTKRRMPIPILIALVIALAVTSAVAAYYVYTTYAASQQEGQTDTATEYEEPLEINPEFDAAIAAYADILDEYRAFMAFINGGGDVNSLARDSDYALVDYPYVNDAFTDGRFENIDCNQFAYVDLDNNGIPELVVGDGSNQPIEVYTYSDGEIVDLFGILAGVRDYWHIEDNGYIYHFFSGGATTYGWELYRLNGSEKQLVESVSLDSKTEGVNDRSPLYIVEHKIVDDDVDEITTTYDLGEAEEIYTNIQSKYLSEGEAITIDWQDL